MKRFWILGGVVSIIIAMLFGVGAILGFWLEFTESRRKSEGALEVSLHSRLRAVLRWKAGRYMHILVP